LKKALLINPEKNVKKTYEFNIINRTIKEEIKAIKNQTWVKFSETFSHNPIQSKPFWKRIDEIKNNGIKKDDTYPILLFEKKEYREDIDKANLFGKLLRETFTDNETKKYDQNFKKMVDEEIKSFTKEFESKNEELECINMENINKFLKNMKKTISCGEDKISNILLKNITNKFKKVLLNLYQTTVRKLVIPNRWKKVIVRMIPKKADGKKDPRNYRPISLTSCLAQLGERFILLEINKHLVENKIIIKQQSGFRSFRQKKDNILCICQRNMEAINKKQMNCTIFFDISKAFDKVWQNGLLYKMREMKFKDLIVMWLFQFLQERTFQIIISNITSDIFEIETSVPQGGVLSPILFSIFINDILNGKTNYKKTEVHSNLFADDLASSSAGKNVKTIEASLNLFLKKLETWLYKWRLDMNAKKCQYMLFGRNHKLKQKQINLKLFNDYIPKTNYIKFLGITLDPRVNFHKCMEEITKKCDSRLNILKI
jgi:molybdopterin converting factor small subunit